MFPRGKGWGVLGVLSVVRKGGGFRARESRKAGCRMLLH